MFIATYNIGSTPLPQREKKSFAQQLKAILLALSKELACKPADELMTAYPDAYTRLVTTCLMEYAEDWSF